MVKGTTKSGIDFSIDERITGDTRFLMYTVDLQDSDPVVQSKALFSLLEFIFGGREGLVSFQNTVAAAHDGICTSELLTSEFTEIMEALNAKKS